MIETKESREEFEKRRERAQAAMRSALKGELPLDSNIPNENQTVRQESVLGQTDQQPVQTKVPATPVILSATPKKKKFDKTAYQREYMRKKRASRRNTDAIE